MKRILFILISFGICYFAQSQIVQSNCNPALDVANSYRNDADYLTMERIRTNNYTYIDSLHIPTSYSDTILNALIAVFNATSIPERDTVVDFLDLHTFQSYSINTVSFTADSSLNWMQNLHAGNVPFGQPVLDNYYNTIGLSLIGYLNLPINIFANARIQFNQNVNVFFVANEINTITNVSIAEPSYYIGDGSTILDTITSNYVELTYRYAWGDCFSGCTASRSYKFKVYYDCSVEFVESFGDVLPPYLGAASLNDSDKMYFAPNSFINELNLVNAEKEHLCTIYNLQGKQVLTGKMGVNSLDVSSLKSGTYIIEIEGSSKTIKRRIIKH